MSLDPRLDARANQRSKATRRLRCADLSSGRAAERLRTTRVFGDDGAAQQAEPRHERFEATAVVEHVNLDSVAMVWRAPEQQRALGLPRRHGGDGVTN